MWIGVGILLGLVVVAPSSASTSVLTATSLGVVLGAVDRDLAPGHGADGSGRADSVGPARADVATSGGLGAMAWGASSYGPTR